LPVPGAAYSHVGTGGVIVPPCGDHHPRLEVFDGVGKRTACHDVRVGDILEHVPEQVTQPFRCVPGGVGTHRHGGECPAAGGTTRDVAIGDDRIAARDPRLVPPGPVASLAKGRKRQLIESGESTSQLLATLLGLWVCQPSDGDPQNPRFLCSGQTEVAESDHALVDAPIAVVIDAVAQFDAWRTGLCIAEEAAIRSTDHLAFLSAGTNPSGEADLSGPVDVVDDAVAVVVDTVAGLRGRAHALAGLQPIHAGRVANGAGAGQARLTLDGRGVVRVIQVRIAVAVVVHTIAHLRGGVNVADADQDAVPALVGPGHTGAELARLAGTATEVFIDLTVAVVVDAVTDLGAGGDAVPLAAVLGNSVDIGEPGAAGETAPPGHAEWGSVCGHGALVATGAAVLGVGLQVEALVGLVVAVVVQAVAHLGGGGALAGALPTGSTSALEGAEDLHFPLTTQASLVGGGLDAVVHVAVAVVVDAVADLLRGLPLGGVADDAVSPRVAHADAGVPAGPTAHAAGRAEVEALVDLPVAVVIATVAGLRGHLATLTAGVAQALVDASIAVVVDTVAGLVLGLRRLADDTRAVAVLAP